MRALAIAVTLLATVASAQQVQDQSVWERCYGTPTPVNPPLIFVGEGTYYSGPGPAPGPGPGPTHGSSGLGSVPSGGGGSGGGEALIAVLVVLAVALPVVVYVVSDDAPDSVIKKFHCPTFSFEGWGGVEGGSKNSTWEGVGIARIRSGYSYFGTDLQFDASPSGVSAFSIDVLLRPTPKEHIEGGLAIGYKRATFGPVLREGLELALPHQYVLYRDEGRQLAIELRPGLLFARNGIDLSVDLALQIPITTFLSARVGTRAFTFDGDTVVGFSAGLSFHP